MLPGMHINGHGIVIRNNEPSELARRNPDKTVMIESSHCPINGDYGHPDHQRGLDIVKGGYFVLYSPKIEPNHRSYASTIIDGRRA